MRTLLYLLIAAISLTGQVVDGKLDGQPVHAPGPRWSIFSLSPAAPSEQALLPTKRLPEDLVWTGKIWWNGSRVKHWAAVIYGADGVRQLAIDLDGDQKIADSEIRSFRRVASEPGAWELTWKMHVPGPYAELPILFRVLEANRDAKKEQPLHINDRFFMYGSVNLSGRPVRVAFQYLAGKGGIDPKNGSLGVDGNGDSLVDMSPKSPEWASTKNKTAVFRSGADYISLESVDLITGRIRARLHNASDYSRIEMLPGSRVPDFTFVDFQGRARRLSEFKGKIVALDFWGSWCGPCLVQMPKLKEIYARYRERGFEILGMNKDDELKKAESIVTKFELQWPQAQTASINELIEDHFRIVAWPTLILLDSEGRIIAASIDLDALDKQLAARLPR